MEPSGIVQLAEQLPAPIWPLVPTLVLWSVDWCINRISITTSTLEPCVNITHCHNSFSDSEQVVLFYWSRGKPYVQFHPKS